MVILANEVEIKLITASVAHIVYPGDGEYGGLFAEVDLTRQARDRRNVRLTAHISP